jgi:hypothetical protein
MSTWDAQPDPEDERPVSDDAEIVLPDRLEVPLEASEADVVDQAVEVPPDDEG